MLGLRLERGPAPLWLRALIPVVAILITFLIVSVLIVAAGANPLETFYQLLIVPLTKSSQRAELLVKVTPLLLTGVAVTFAFASGYYNIGAEGQLLAGALAAAWIGRQFEFGSPWVAIPAMILGSFLAGMLWALSPALLKVRLGVDEVVTTLLLNSVMLFFITALLNGPWRNDAGWPQSPDIFPAAQFPQLFERTRIHLGFVIAVVALLVLWWVFTRTRFGLEVRAAGIGPVAARFMGVRVGRVMLMAALISGGIAGLAGASEVAGVHFHLIDAISGGYGYTGIIIATLGALTGPGVALAALFIALLDIGILSTSRELGIPVYLGDVIQACLLLVALATLLLNRYSFRRIQRD